MTKRKLAIKEHLAAHEAKIAKRRKVRLQRGKQLKKRGLAAAIALALNR